MKITILVESKRATTRHTIELSDDETIQDWKKNENP